MLVFIPIMNDTACAVVGRSYDFKTYYDIALWQLVVVVVVVVSSSSSSSSSKK
jgi:hypothetical protein